MRSLPRDTALDLLRILGAFAVVVIHVSAGAVPAVDVSSPSWWVANVSNGGSRWGDAVIMMVGGAILLGRDSERTPVQFAAGRFARLLPAVVFWSVFYWLWRAWLGELAGWREVALDLLRGVPYYHMWFLYMMLGMYLALPLIRRIVSGEDKRLHYYFLALCFALTAVEGLARVVQNMSHASFPGLFPIYIVYFVGGYLLYRDRPQIPMWLLIGVPLCCFALVALGVAVLHPILGEPVFKLMYTNRGPLVMLGTFCLFLLVLRVVPTTDSRQPAWHRLGGEQLARLTLGIYVLHPFWIVMLARSGLSVFRFDPVWSIGLLSVLVFALSAVTALALSLVRPLRRLVV